MTDLEIISWLYELEPETEAQRNKILQAISIFVKEPKRKSRKNGSADEYLEELAFDEIEGKLTKRIYIDYEKWCANNSLIPEAKNTLGVKIREKFKLISAPRKINGKTERIYTQDI